MKVLLIDKNLIDLSNYQKWNMLAQKESVSLRAITPAEWVENSRVLRFSDSFAEEFPVVALRTVWRGKENRGFYLRGLGAEIRRFKPEVIICFEEPFSFFALQTFFSAAFFSPASKLVFYSWDNRAKGKDYAYRPAFAYAVIERIVMRRADLLLTANEEGTEYFRKAYSIPVRKLYFGVNVDPPKNKDDATGNILTNIPAGSFVVGYVGRLLEMKGIDTLIRAVSMLEANVVLVILGSGPDENRLKTLVAELSLDSRVIFISAVPSFQTKPIMSMLNVLVLPSRTTKQWKEQYGRVLIECMSLGIPVIGSDSGAIPEVIGDCGIVFHEDDVTDLAESIKRLMYDEALASDLSRRGIERAREFSSAKFADNLYTMLVELNT